MSKKKNVTTTISIIVVCCLALLGYTIIKSSHEKDLDNVRKQEEQAWNDKVHMLQNEISDLKNEISDLTGDMPEELDVLEDGDYGSEFGETSRDEAGEFLKIENVERRIAEFFLKLDEQDYIKHYALEGSSYSKYEGIIEKLSSKAPLISNETESLYNMFLNIAYFYRVLGKNDLLMIKDVLFNEIDSIESIMRDFYMWYTHDYEDNKRVKGCPSIDVLYKYSGFFLTTIGGRNYLMRRDSKIRILTSYYSVLFLDRANDMKRNPHGIDIRPYIKMLSSDISNYTGLDYRREYIKHINELESKYRIK